MEDGKWRGGAMQLRAEVVLSVLYCSERYFAGLFTMAHSRLHCNANSRLVRNFTLQYYCHSKYWEWKTAIVRIYRGYYN